ncbi:uncharacterized protein LOC142585064 isoform X2 [Dermacentor variabilis]|uniref:uncharacterized protein LOC142585064 isoform X2 n=1 Tax=Dermacentor variabilis TaxID=34621 RepID=UPI003F5C88B8
MTHCIFVVLLIGSATGTFDYKGRATLADLMEFFRTTERIAVLVRSYSRLIDGEDVIKCSSEMTPGHLTKEFISTGEFPLTIRNTHHYNGKTYMAGVGIGYPVYMRLSKEPGLDVSPTMWATRKEGGQHDDNGRMYYFDYYDPEGKCAVITFSDGPCSLKCELHVWENYFFFPKENCVREYKYYCGADTYYILYDENICPYKQSIERLKTALNRGALPISG